MARGNKDLTRKKNIRATPRLSVVIPCYNEEKNIPLLLEKLSSVVPSGVEIILVDNGSTDGSAAVLKKLLPKYHFARTVRVAINQGYGFGILTGLKAAHGEYIGWTHADLQTDPHDVIKALDLIENVSSKNPLFIKGLRRGRPLFDKIFTWGMGVFETLYLRTPLWDINAQPTIFHRSLYENWKNPPHDFSLDLYAMYTAKHSGFDIVRFPVLFPERLHGVSSWNTGLRSKWKFIKRTLDFSFRLKRTL
jgi:glycosyltransferase involved in cell wall biosynthesis